MAPGDLIFFQGTINRDDGISHVGIYVGNNEAPSISGTSFITDDEVDAFLCNHIIWNSTSLDCSRKFRNFWGSTKVVRRLSDIICVENGLSIVENPQRKGMHYGTWLGDQKKPTHHDTLRSAIDAALEKKPQTMDALLDSLRQAGIEIKNGKQPSLRAEGWKQYARLDSLKNEYSLEDLRSIIAGEKAFVPRQRDAVTKTEPKVSLLVDIQQKLQAGKGAGYEKWAKVYNLKQMAQTLNYLQEHGLTEYTELEVKSAAASERFHTLGGQIKASEKRMAEIAVLRTHIHYYIKTRDIYVAYRKAGYSAKFKAGHESDIMLHQAAKKAFDALSLKKLPTIKSLNAEYAKHLSEKKAAYTEYRLARSEMRELLNARQNVDRILDVEQRNVSHSQRRNRNEGR